MATIISYFPYRLNGYRLVLKSLTGPATLLGTEELDNLFVHR